MYHYITLKHDIFLVYSGVKTSVTRWSNVAMVFCKVKVLTVHLNETNQKKEEERVS